MCGTKEFGPSILERAYPAWKMKQAAAAYFSGFIDEGQREQLMRVLGLWPKTERRKLPIYCPPEYYWRECEGWGRKGNDP